MGGTLLDKIRPKSMTRGGYSIYFEEWDIVSGQSHEILSYVFAASSYEKGNLSDFFT
jgi:hypothetical protein